MIETTQGARLWRSLTVIDEKRGHFEDEAYFRESWAAATGSLGDGAARVLQSVAILVIQPDCIAWRKVDTCLDYFTDRQFMPVLVKPIQFNRHHIRELWRYQSPVSTLDSVALAELVCTKTESMLIFFADLVPEPVMPASTRLTMLKGSARPAKRAAGSLRSVLDCPNPNIVLVHASDEPVDIVRELGIFYDYESLLGIYSELGLALAELKPVDSVKLVADAYRKHPENGMCAELSAKILLAEIDALGNGEHAEYARSLRAMIDGARHGRSLDWFAFSRHMALAGIDNHSWDALVVGAHYIQHSRPGRRNTIDSSGLGRWSEGDGVILIPELGH
jgi:hypothetical protein